MKTRNANEGPVNHLSSQREPRPYQVSQADGPDVLGKPPSPVLRIEHDEPVAVGYAQAARELGVPAERLLLLDPPVDTAQEAYAVKAALGMDRPFLLVTSASHMARAMRHFETAGLAPIAAPTHFRTGRRETERLKYWIPSADQLRKTERAVYVDAYRPRLRYLLIEESAYADAELATMRNLAAALFRLENSQGPKPVREVIAALAEWLAEPEQAELRRSFVLWLREAFLRTRLPAVQFPELNNLEEIRIMLTERVLDWTQQWKQEGRQEGLRSERRALLRLIRRRFGETVADQSTPVLERIEQPSILEDLFENLLDCPDGSAWLARLQQAAAGEERH